MVYPPPPPMAGPQQGYYPAQPVQYRRGMYSDVRLEMGIPMTDPHLQQPRQPYNQGYMPNGAPGSHPNLQPAPGATPLLPNQGRVIQTGPIRVLCIADVRGKLDI